MPRPGFSLLEVVVAVGILAILGATAVPTVVAYRDQQRIQQTAEDLTNLSLTFLTYKFPTNPFKYPRLLSHFSTQVLSTDLTSCAAPNRTYGQEGNAQTRWPVGAPYINKLIPLTGMELGIGVADNTVVRSTIPFGTGTTGTNSTVSNLHVSIPGVTYDDARALNDILDGQGDVDQVNRTNTRGAVRWTAVPDANNLVTVIYIIPAAKTC